MAIKRKARGGPRLSIIPARAVTDPDICAQAFRVLGLLGRHTDDAGWCRRSQVTMAEELGCSRATVQRGLTELEAAGYVEKRLEGRPNIDANPEKQPFAAYSYRVILDPVDDPAEAPVDKDGGVPTGEHGGCSSGRAPGAHLSGHGVPIWRAPLTERLLGNDPLITDGPVPPRDPDGRGDPVLWEMLEAGMDPHRLKSLVAWGPGLEADGAGVTVFFPKDFAERHVASLRHHVALALARPVRFLYAGREGHL